MKTQIDQLIINSPYVAPSEHWLHDQLTKKWIRKKGRRPAGYVVASKDSKEFDDPGVFKSIPNVDQIRKRVKSWRERGYPGSTGITKKLLDYWTDQKSFDLPFFFCQIEAIETLIWLKESSEHERIGIEIPSDGGPFERICSKMATGTGKTVVMAMLITWHVLNKVTYPRDRRFSKNIFIITPGLTIKERLRVLDPSEKRNYYKEFKIVPSTMFSKIRQARVLINNWHSMLWETEEKVQKRRSVDRRGPLSDAAYLKNLLGDMAGRKNILVINDEAHHAWRVPEGVEVKGIKKEVEEATKWIAGLDRINRKIGILSCHDFSATPFIPSGKQSSEENLFKWIVSDFGLSDAIESGLVKTPRIVVREDGIEDKSRLYHIFSDEVVHSNLNKKLPKERSLPQLVLNAYMLLGLDWRETKEVWEKNDAKTPPVMISVANRTETAARIKYAFDNKKIPQIEELCDPENTLHIDSNVLKIAESDGSHSTSGTSQRGKEAESLRKKVDTVGKLGQPGESIKHVISVNMLTEGWDARTVTHIMGLRAFHSQLLCEQVVGRGLRRTSYEINPKTRLYEPEYVNVFGIPFSFLPHEGGDNAPPPSIDKYLIKPTEDKIEHKIEWPNIVRIEHIMHPQLTLNLTEISLLEISVNDIIQMVELAPVVDGKAKVSLIEKIGLIKLAENSPRLQESVFKSAVDVFERKKEEWKKHTGFSKPYLMAQLVRLMERFINSDKLKVVPDDYHKDDFRRRLSISFKTDNITNHIEQYIEFNKTTRYEPVFDTENPILSTGFMLPWYTSKLCVKAAKSHINACVCDSSWERSDAEDLDRSNYVQSWVKNDHLGFKIDYLYKGTQLKYLPDFIVKLKNGKMLIIETKGIEREKDKVKQKYLGKWIEAVNTYGRFGIWANEVVRKPGAIKAIIEKHAKTNSPRHSVSKSV